MSEQKLRSALMDKGVNKEEKTKTWSRRVLSMRSKTGSGHYSPLRFVAKFGGNTSIAICAADFLEGVDDGKN